MSVIVFNTEENAMYADTIVSLGSVCTYQAHKVNVAEFDNGWRLLLGKIGTPAIFAVAEQYVVELIEHYAQNEVSLQALNGRAVVAQPTGLVEKYYKQLEASAARVPTAEYSFLIAINDGVDTVVGVMDNNLNIHWGIRPLYGRRDIVLGSHDVTSAYNSTPDRKGRRAVSTIEKLQAINAVQFIGVRNNRFLRYGFDGGVDE